jgi:hypothetical protein
MGDNPEQFGIRIHHKDYDKYLVAGKDVDPVASTILMSPEDIRMGLKEAKCL